MHCIYLYISFQQMSFIYHEANIFLSLICARNLLEALHCPVSAFKELIIKQRKRSEKVLCATTETSTEVCGSTWKGCLCSRLLCLNRCDFELSQYKTDPTRRLVWLDYQLLAQLWYHSPVRKYSSGYHSQIRRMYRIRLGVKVT